MPFIQRILIVFNYYNVLLRSSEGIDVLSDGDLPKALTTAMLSVEVEECLQTAITCWEECVKKMDDHNLVPVSWIVLLLHAWVHVCLCKTNACDSFFLSVDESVTVSAQLLSVTAACSPPLIFASPHCNI